MTATNDENKLDNMTVRRFAKLLKKGGSSSTSTPITTGTVIQNNNELYVAVDNETFVPITDTNSNVKMGDKVTLAFNDTDALIVGNITDNSPTVSELIKTNKSVALAHKEADDASKVATNYIDIDENKGITVGNMQEETLGKNTYIDANGFYIRDGETNLAQFKEDEISLGENSETATIYLCKRQGEVCYVDTELMDFLQIKTPDQFFDGTKEDFSPTDFNIILLHLATGEITGSDGLPVAKEECITIIPMLGTVVSINDDSAFYVDDGHLPFGEGNTFMSVGRHEAFIKSYGSSGDNLSWHNTFKNKPKETTIELEDSSRYDFETCSFFTKTYKFTDENLTVDDTPVSLEGHTHTMSEVTGTLPISKGGTGSTTASGALTALGGAKASHTHTKSQITDFDHDHSGDALTPATINTTSTIKQNGTAVSLRGHKHSATDITSGTLPVARGGTGATDASTARTNLGCAATSHNHSASQITSGTLAVARGGTGKTTGTFYGIVNLYNNGTGTNGTVTLSQMAANFTYLEIFYRLGTQNELSSVKVFSPNGKKVKLNQSFWASGTSTTQTDFETITISTTSITRGTMGYFQTSGSSLATGTATRQFYIVRVDGYK